LTPPRILIIDDDEEIAPLFRRTLENAGYSVSSTLSGKEGLRAIREEAFDLVILDLAIPEVDGFEILRAVRDQLRKPKIIAISGMIPNMLQVAKLCGADLVIEKSSALHVLVMSVCSLIETPSCT
jgi:DNA-binding response OmpR family regulator